MKVKQLFLFVILLFVIAPLSAPLCAPFMLEMITSSARLSDCSVVKGVMKGKMHC